MLLICGVVPAFLFIYLFIYHSTRGRILSADIPPSPDVSHPEFCPADVPPSLDISHPTPDAGWERRTIQIPRTAWLVRRSRFVESISARNLLLLLILIGMNVIFFIIPE